MIRRLPGIGVLCAAVAVVALSGTALSPLSANGAGSASAAVSPQVSTSSTARSGVGSHSFYVAARQKGRQAVRADFGWRALEAEPFEVEPRPGSVGPLRPGAGPLPIRVVISNPNDVPITITSLRVIASGGEGCPPKADVALTAPDLGQANLRIPANGSLILPNAKVAAPTIRLRETGVDQDACRSAKFDLAFSGSAGA
jgi:hypothetical protein